jgi:hypothetical protein
MIERIAARIDPRLWKISGKVFYSGRNAFSGPASIYVLGFNPGGDPASRTEETVGGHTERVLFQAPADWSAYYDEVWKERAKRAGEAPLQRRMRHLLSGLRLDPRCVPASNLIFTRSRRSGGLPRVDLDTLIKMCWPVHQEVLDTLCPKALICFGIETGKRVIRQLGVTREIGPPFKEQNDRGWKSRAWETPTGLIVFGLPHPSIADWTNPLTDPTRMVVRALNLN